MVTVRELSDRDFASVCALFHSVFTGPPWYDDWSDPDQMQAYIRDLMCNPNSLAFGCFSDDCLIAASLGSVMHWFSGTQYYIYEFFVSAAMQNTGIGSKLLQEIETQIRSKGIVSVFLQTGDEMPAYKFYSKHGFTQIPHHVSMMKTLSGEVK